MTTKKDNLENRLKQLGEGQEESIGVAEDGFQDPTGEYPRRDYNFGSGINKEITTSVQEGYKGK